VRANPTEQAGSNPAEPKGGGLTRGKGVLEPFLARQRARIANQLITAEARGGRILDIGCGTFPYFLAHTAFAEKFAIDQLPMPEPVAAGLQISSHALNLNEEPSLPFGDAFFRVVTLLAVVEHLSPDSMALLFREVFRVLQPGGRVIMTTPAAWSDGLLRMMARLRLVSAEEIEEHSFAYTLPLIGWYFGQAGFKMRTVRFGYFELMLNMWGTADK
jgi:SAM-dependent methyltransferase